MATFCLFECGAGFGLFELAGFGKLGAQEVHECAFDLGRFGKIVTLTAFQPFENAEAVLEHVRCVSRGLASKAFLRFLKLHLPNVSQHGHTEKDFRLGIADSDLEQFVASKTNIPCFWNETICEVTHGIRIHLRHFVTAGNEMLRQFDQGLSSPNVESGVASGEPHSDSVVVQTGTLMDQLDKDLNTVALLVREQYSWHFPELSKLISDNFQYSQIAQVIGNRNEFDESKLEELQCLAVDANLAQRIMAATTTSVGVDISTTDMHNINLLADMTQSLHEHRQQLLHDLRAKLFSVAPNVAALADGSVAPRVASTASSLPDLTKCPASTFKIRGAENALFRALKAKRASKKGRVPHSLCAGGGASTSGATRVLCNECTAPAPAAALSEYVFAKYQRGNTEQV